MESPEIRLLVVDPDSVSNEVGKSLLSQLYQKHPLGNNGYDSAATVCRDGDLLAGQALVAKMYTTPQAIVDRARQALTSR